MELKESTFDENGNVNSFECEIKEVKLFTSFLVYSYINDDCYIILEERTDEPFKGLYELPSYEVNDLTVDGNTKRFSDEFGMTDSKFFMSGIYEYINIELGLRKIFIILSKKMKDHTKVKMNTKKKIKFYNISNLPDMAFDHDGLIDYNLGQIQN